MAAAGGMNTEYKRNFGAGIDTWVNKDTSNVGIKLEQLFVSATYGRKVSSNISVGLSALYAYQTFRATGLGIFDIFQATADPAKLSDNGNDTSSGFGMKIGVQGNWSRFKVGIAYQPKVKMTKFKKYEGLFANQGELDIPSLLVIGTAFKITDKAIIALDYQYIDYADVAAIGNSIDKFSQTDEVLFGSTDGPRFGWKSISVYKLGFAYEATKDWTFRVGWNKGENPIPKGEYSLAFVAPAIITDHLTLGFTKIINKSSSYSMNFVQSFKNSITDEFSSTFGGGTITIEMEQKALEFGYTKIF